ncbi:MAG: CRTAC1 family protein [Ignavibacteriae bacterium]|nr:CRTAC1 family protein [Ignavibacteriota bacterium]
MKNILLTIIFTLVLVSISLAQDPFQPPQETFGKYVTNSIAWGDYNNDGYTDVYMTNGLSAGFSIYYWENFLYKNNGNSTFDSVSAAGSIVSDQYLSGASGWGDYDNDGMIDMLVAEPLTRTTGGGPFTQRYSKNTLYGNNANNTFSIRSAASLVNEEQISKIVTGWLDFNNDGWLDAFVSQASFSGTAENHALYENNQDGTFTKISNTLTGGTSARGGFSSADFDEDGDMDLVTTSGTEGQSTVLWKNTGSDFSSTILIASGGTTDRVTNGVSWGDFDNDGLLDLIATNNSGSLDSKSINTLFRNDGAGNLVVVTTGVGSVITDQDLSAVSAWGDYDSDGDLDLFVGNDGRYTSGYRSRLYENDGTGVFSHKTTIFADSSSFSRSGAWADIENDGDLDFLLGREGYNRLFINNGNSNVHLTIKCVGDGVNSNTSAIGALVKVNAEINSSTYTQVRDVSAQSGTGSHNDLRTHFGMGNAVMANSILVKWPGSVNSNMYTDLPTNKFIVFTQGDLDVTTDITKVQSFMYLFGNTGGSIEFTTADADGGSLNMVRTDSDPGGSYSGITQATTPGGSTITPNSVYPDKFWTVIPTGLTGFTSTVYFDASGLTGSPNLDEVVLMKRNGGDWTALNTSRIGNTLYAMNINSFSDFAIGYQESGVLVETKIFMEGAYDSNLDEMTTTLNPADIPLTSPYTEDARIVGSIPANVVDWILVELRTSTESSSTVISKSVFLHKDGRIVADDGTTGQIELDAPAGSYYIVIKHRNHLSVMSSEPLIPLNSSTTTLYDFTTGSGQFYGTDGATQIDN